MIRIDAELTLQKLRAKLERLLEISAAKIRAIAQTANVSAGTPVLTVEGVYRPREWTDWTQGFMYGSALLQYDATGEEWFLDYGRRNSLERMGPYLTHTGVHDHGFNTVSTFGNLLRLAHEGRMAVSDTEKRLYELAVKVSGAVQAARWSRIRDGRGYIYSFNGPHSLFADTIRSLRVLALGHRLGHALLGEGDRRISLLARLVYHAAVTADYSVYYGTGRDIYDVRGRVAHESIFDMNDGNYRCPSTQQGYSPFSTWTRGLAWIMCGYAEELEYLAALDRRALDLLGGFEKVEAMMLEAAQATCDYYLEQTAQDGVPYWDTAAPQLAKLGDWGNKPSYPFNDFEPVDSSAAAVAAQGLWRLGRYLEVRSTEAGQGKHYRQAALTIAGTLADEPYLSTRAEHQGLILHSVYHRPKGWDYVAPGRKIPYGESSMWGDYHARELALLLLREAKGEPYLTFFEVAEKPQNQAKV